MIRHEVTIDFRSGSLNSDDFLIYQILIFMIEVDTILNNMSSTSRILSIVKIGSIKLGADIDIFGSIVCIRTVDFNISKSCVWISTKGVKTLEGFFS